MDDLSDEELRVLPVLPRAGSLGGVVVLVDDPEAMWLTKSAGVRIVHVVSSGGSSDDERRPHRLRGLQPEDQAKLSAAVGVPLHENPLCAMLHKSTAGTAPGEEEETEGGGELACLLRRAVRALPVLARQCLAVTRGLTESEACNCQ